MTQTLPKLSKPVRSIKNGTNVVHAYDNEAAECIEAIATVALITVGWVVSFANPLAFAAYSIVAPTAIGLAIGNGCS